MTTRRAGEIHPAPEFVASPADVVRPAGVSLWALALTGACGTAAVTVGASQGASPFTLKMPGAWLFGVASGATAVHLGADARLLGIALVYAGLVVVLATWYELVRAARRGRVSSVRVLVPVLAAWAAPLLVVGPLFSRDAYAYAAQGEMLVRGINPYVHGPAALGPGPFLSLVDPLWRHATAPYGPLWVRLTEALVVLSGHHLVATMVWLRAVAVTGAGLLAWGIADLARGSGAPPPVAFALGAMNPVVLLDLVAGSHNDALMLGLLVTACALARRHRIAAAVVVCAAAASVKLPAIIGILYIGWCWAPPDAPLRSRLARAGAALGATAGLIVSVTWASGLGWHVFGGLGNPGVVVSWLDPATAAGLGVANALHALGVAADRSVFVSAARAMALALAGILALWLFARARPGRETAAMGWSLLVVAVLGPVVWPWYETWGFAFLATSVGLKTGDAVSRTPDWALAVVVVFSTAACFADLPPVASLRGGHGALVWTCASCLLLGVGAVVARQVVTLRRSPRPA